jgi:S1-C subfamily serine protease
LAIARVAPNSPFTNKLQMGDIIIKVNNQTILHSDDLKRIIMFSGQQTNMEI